MQTLRIALTAAAVLVAAAPAFAQTAPVVVEATAPTATVSYADLNIASDAGRLVLERRVRQAATDLCLANRREPLDQVMAERQCFLFAMTHARSDIDLAVARARTQIASGGTITVAAR
jgi:UrcA family protein